MTCEFRADKGISNVYSRASVNFFDGRALCHSLGSDHTDLFAPQCIALAQHALAHLQESDAALAALIARYPDTCAYQVAEVHAFRGEINLAFASLERAFDLRDHGPSY